jgi:hypothetical protein
LFAPRTDVLADSAFGPNKNPAASGGEVEEGKVGRDGGVSSLLPAITHWKLHPHEKPQSVQLVAAAQGSLTRSNFKALFY